MLEKAKERLDTYSRIMSTIDDWAKKLNGMQPTDITNQTQIDSWKDQLSIYFDRVRTIEATVVDNNKALKAFSEIETDIKKDPAFQMSQQMNSTPQQQNAQAQQQVNPIQQSPVQRPTEEAITRGLQNLLQQRQQVQQQQNNLQILSSPNQFIPLQQPSVLSQQSAANLQDQLNSLTTQKHNELFQIINKSTGQLPERQALLNSYAVDIQNRYNTAFNMIKSAGNNVSMIESIKITYTNELENLIKQARTKVLLMELNTPGPQQPQVQQQNTQQPQTQSRPIFNKPPSYGSNDPDKLTDALNKSIKADANLKNFFTNDKIPVMYRTKYSSKTPYSIMFKNAKDREAFIRKVNLKSGQNLGNNCLVLTHSQATQILKNISPPKSVQQTPKSVQQATKLDETSMKNAASSVLQQACQQDTTVIPRDITVQTVFDKGRKKYMCSFSFSSTQEVNKFQQALINKLRLSKEEVIAHSDYNYTSNTTGKTRYTVRLSLSDADKFYKIYEQEAKNRANQKNFKAQVQSINHPQGLNKDKSSQHNKRLWVFGKKFN